MTRFSCAAFLGLVFTTAAATADAQPCGTAGIDISVFPSAPVLGEPIQIIVTNLTANCTYVISDSCVYHKVFSGSCGGSAVLPFRQCAIGQVFIPPGQSIVDVWNQKNGNGQQVPPGTYFFDVTIGEVGGQKHGFCPSVAIDSCPTPPLIYGTGSVGTGGFTPTWTVNVLPKPGGPFSVTIDQAVGGAPSLFVLGAGSAQIPVDFGDFLIDPNLPVIYLPFSMSGASGVGGAGTVTFGFTVPNDTSLVGVTVYTQCLVQDFASTGNIATTAGLQISICPL